ncbi:MAG: hypothetical protein K5870_01395, partial [Lachnospiraceae bacterium]|nr:hypothetical protein [Lachnospiraceae bacterium]
LMDSIRQFEELERKGDHSGKEWRINPSPEVRYQSNLDYLSELCAFMSEKYCEEYVWGDKNLSDDTEVE